jgi:hypothetical protein
MSHELRERFDYAKKFLDHTLADGDLGRLEELERLDDVAWGKRIVYDLESRVQHVEDLEKP